MKPGRNPKPIVFYYRFNCGTVRIHIVILSYDVMLTIQQIMIHLNLTD
jgi:hypothetical protein